MPFTHTRTCKNNLQWHLNITSTFFQDIQFFLGIPSCRHKNAIPFNDMCGSSKRQITRPMHQVFIQQSSIFLLFGRSINLDLTHLKSNYQEQQYINIFNISKTFQYNHLPKQPRVPCKIYGHETEGDLIGHQITQTLPSRILSKQLQLLPHSSL